MKKEQIKLLNVSETVVFRTSNVDELKEIIKDLDGNFIINKVSNELTSVLRIDDSIVSGSTKILSKLKGLTWFNRIELKYSLPYVRTLISKYNKDNDDCIKVSKVADKVIIFRLFDVDDLTTEELADCMAELKQKYDSTNREELEEIM